MRLDIPMRTTLSAVITAMAAALSAFSHGMIQEPPTGKTSLT